MLGYYNRGKQFPDIIINNVNGAIQSVMLPALSKHNGDNAKVKVDFTYTDAEFRAMYEAYPRVMEKWEIIKPMLDDCMK